MKDETFVDGIWFSVQHLVLVQDKPSIAADIISESGISKEECIKAQLRSGYMNERMKEFIEKEQANGKD